MGMKDEQKNKVRNRCTRTVTLASNFESERRVTWTRIRLMITSSKLIFSSWTYFLKFMLVLRLQALFCRFFMVRSPLTKVHLLLLVIAGDIWH